MSRPKCGLQTWKSMFDVLGINKRDNGGSEKLCQTESIYYVCLAPITKTTVSSNKYIFTPKV